MVDTVHTLPREIRAVGGFTFGAERYRAITVPTVLLAGSESPPELRRGVELVQGAVNDALVVVMDGVDHEAVTTGSPGTQVLMLHPRSASQLGTVMASTTTIKPC
jgi:hypothetical protein